MKTAIVPIIKHNTGDATNKSNYRASALIRASSKIIESCLSSVLGDYIVTHGPKFGCKKSIQQIYVYSLLRV